MKRVATLLAVLAVSACGSGHVATDGAPAALWSPPDPVVVAAATSVPAAGATPSAPAAAVPDCGNPVMSFAPDGPRAPAGSMPVGSYMDTIARRGRLVVGVSADTLLFGARSPITGRMEGFDIDMLRAVAKAIFGSPDKIEYKVITYAQRIPSLQNHSVDVVAHTMTINCKRWATIDFSAEYFHAGQKVLVRADATAKGIDDLSGKKVCAAKGSTNIDNLVNYPKVITVGVDDLTDCMVAFQQGSVDAVTADDTVLAGFAAQDPYAKVVGKAFTDEPYGLGVAKEHPDFVKFINSVLEDVKATGAWEAAYNHWLGKVAPAPAPPAALYGRRP